MSFRHFTTADGLPSSETYFTLEDQNGYIWIGTDNGLARYDGYEFRVYDGKDGLTSTVVFGGLETEDGKLWVGTYSGEVFYYENDRFFPSKCNPRLLEFKERSRIVELIDVLEDESVVIKSEIDGFIVIDTALNHRSLVDLMANDLSIYVSNAKKAEFPQQTRDFVGANYPYWEVEKKVNLVYAEGESKYIEGATLNTLTRKKTLVLKFYDKDDEFIVKGVEGVDLVKADGETSHLNWNCLDVKSLIPNGQNRYFASVANGVGLLDVEIDFDEQFIRADTFLRGHSLAMGYYDHSGGLWVNTTDAGVFYCSNKNLKIIRAKEQGVILKPTSIALSDNKNLYLACSNGEVYEHLGKENETRWVQEGNGGVKSRKSNWINDLSYFAKENSLYIQNRKLYKSKIGVHRNSILNLDGLISVAFLQVFDIKEYGHFKGQDVWTSDFLFGEIYYDKGSLSTRINDDRIIYSKHGFQSYAIFPDGREFVGTLYGLKEVTKDSSIIDNDLGIPALQNRIERIVELNDNAVIIGTRGAGIVYYARDTSYVINTTEGLASENVRNLHVTDDGNLWVATLSGLSKVSFSPDGKSYNLRTFRIGNGLIDNEVHDMDSRDNHLWLASTAGVYEFIEPPFDSVSRPPVIDWIQVNGEDWEDNLYAFSPSQNNLAFQFTTTILSLGDQVNYRYRLNTNQPWQTTKNRVANYPSLPAGNYRFEVQSQNKDGIWSESSAVSFSVDAYFINTWKPWAIGFILFSSAIALWFWRREQVRSREQKLLLRISELEHSALHAQMNPHFVFNALNSIQNFVLHNQTREAATYLSRFAVLIRNTLRASVKGEHSLEEEVEMLTRYLELEKLRFKDVFDFTISVEDGISLETVKIPPLLIQPFVENAILHGLRERSAGGEIFVGFSGDENLLEVIIEDNGVGIDLGSTAKDDSYGMGITKERLKIMAGKKSPGVGMTVVPLLNADDSCRGTQVQLKIRPITPHHTSSR